MGTLDRFAHFELSEMKLVYRVLHQHLLEHVELMDAEFFEALQRWLQTIAGSQGVDVSDHAQWDAWLGNTIISCEERVADRTVIPITER
ncbi:MAG: hypothetical protein AAFV53_01880 [Myxococcota bacterium]